VFPELEPHAARLRGTTLRALFDESPDRAERMSVTAGELELDLSKNLLDDDAVAALVALARERGLPERIEAMFTGEHINTTEDRAVLHTALRRPAGAPPGRRRPGRDGRGAGRARPHGGLHPQRALG
jgi:glucose-6-phosphate isomerase